MAGLKKSQHLKLELKEIRAATNNFQTCIGNGGFGMVYKGELTMNGIGRSDVISNWCGTFGYCEPEYLKTGIMNKKSDVYSFGMVLFEVMCGKLCLSQDNDGFTLTAVSAKEYHEKKRLNEIIDPRIREQISPSSLNSFSTLAYKCLHEDREQRPHMDVVTKELEETLKIQVEYESWKKEEEYWKIKLPYDSEEIIERLNPPLRQYSTRKDLFMLLHKGFFFDNGEREKKIQRARCDNLSCWTRKEKRQPEPKQSNEKFFSLDDDGKKCEIISAKGFVKQKKSVSPQKTPHSPHHLLGDESVREEAEAVQKRKAMERGDLLNKRGKGYESPMMRWYPHTAELNLYFQIRTSLLSTDTMYAANLVFSFKEWDDHSSLHLESSRWVWIKWKCEELCVSSAHFATRRDDGNYKTTLWHFFSSDSYSYFDIILNKLLGGEEEKLPYIIIHGLEFHPLEMKKSLNGTEEIEGESISVQDFDWENKLPSDYQDNGRKWFSLCESTGEKCHMLPAVDIFRNDSNYEHMDRLLLSESRFKEGIQLHTAPQYYFTCKLEADMFSSGKLYAIYLVFKFVDGDTRTDIECLLEAYCELNDKRTSTIFAHLNLREPIPIIRPKKKNTKLRNLWNMPKAKGCGVPKWCFTGTHNWMKQRHDGWMEILLCKPFDELEQYNSLNIKLRCLIGTLYGTIVQGVEFRPMEKDI
ncbi:hypothetical protein L1987_03597 [Smallanthus sonchifolius]|uniref:Uncharacterized protein n=1 Tax=Smallanthus sonchifolius TaxID=185202 RepID=A0ACB9KB17_9ASTR|nr:hypothetical protein L1987_03597 [Smallanthus sonchifolius]